MNQNSLATFEYPKNMSITSVLIFINVLVYMLILYKGGPSAENLVAFGAKQNGLIAEGQYFRLFSALFLHGSFIHLVLNMYTLFQLGRLLEPIVGYRTFIFIYVLSGATGNVLSSLATTSISVGASGCIFGIATVLWVLEKYEAYLTKLTGRTKNRSTLGSLLFIWMIASFLLPNIDWASHLGGAIAGVLLGISIALQHYWRVRLFDASRFLYKAAVTSRRNLFYKESFYVFLLLLINIIGISRLSNVALEDIIYGKGLLRAGFNETPYRSEMYLPQFKSLFIEQKSESNTNNLLHAAKHFIEKEEWHSAIYALEALKTFHSLRLGDEDFCSKSTSILLDDALMKAHHFKSSDAFIAQTPSLEIHNQNQSDSCYQMAELLYQLGFYSIAGKLYSCKFFEGHISEKELKNIGSKVVSSYVKANEPNFVDEFLSQVRSLKTSPAHRKSDQIEL